MKTTAPGSLQTGEPAKYRGHSFEDCHRRGPDGQKRTLVVEALGKARDLAARIGDD